MTTAETTLVTGLGQASPSRTIDEGRGPGPVIKSFKTFEEAERAAYKDAMVNQSIMSPAMLYKQGNRYFILTTFSFQTLTRHVRYDSAEKGRAGASKFGGFLVATCFWLVSSGISPGTTLSEFRHEALVRPLVDQLFRLVA